jgi:hypothetical protein
MKIFRKIALTCVLASFGALPAYAADQLFTPEEEGMLQPSDKVDGAKVYTSSDWDAETYRKVLIGSVTVYFADDSKSKEIDPDTLKALTDEMKSIVATSAGRYAEVVNEPGPGVALINLAIVDLKMKNKKRGLLGYTPVGFVVTSAANAAGARLTLAGAKIQSESVDSQTGKLLGLTEVEEIEQLDAEKELTWDDVKMTLRTFADRIIDVRFGAAP